MSLKIKKILFPTDLTEHARYAYNFAASIANHYGATLAILHVMINLPTRAEDDLKEFLGEVKFEEFKKKHEEETREILIGKKRDGAMIRQALNSFCQEFKSDDPECNYATDEILVKSGSIVEEIVKQAEASGSDMIVMGYYVRNMMAEAMAGDVTRKVLRRSKKPVLLIPMPENK